jgi:hypothetical protein
LRDIELSLFVVAAVVGILATGILTMITARGVVIVPFMRVTAVFRARIAIGALYGIVLVALANLGVRVAVAARI